MFINNTFFTECVLFNGWGMIFFLLRVLQFRNCELPLSLSLSLPLIYNSFNRKKCQQYYYTMQFQLKATLY